MERCEKQEGVDYSSSMKSKKKGRGQFAKDYRIGDPSQALTRLDEDEKSTLISNEGSPG